MLPTADSTRMDSRVQNAEFCTRSGIADLDALIEACAGADRPLSRGIAQAQEVVATDRAFQAQGGFGRLARAACCSLTLASSRVDKNIRIGQNKITEYPTRPSQSQLALRLGV